MEASEQVLKMLAVMAQMYERAPTEDAARLLAVDLSGYPEEQVLGALARCRMELVRFPTLAEIVQRIDDGRPGTEEAWAMVPKGERDAVVWTQEMQQAFAIAQPLMERDFVGARMAFREKYTDLVAKARATKAPPVWTPSLGFDRDINARVLRDAVEKGRIAAEDAQSLLPVYGPTSQKLLAGPGEEPADPKEVQSNIATIVNNILSMDPAKRRQMEAARKAQREAAREFTEEGVKASIKEQIDRLGQTEEEKKP